jgi:hypothetical protein
MTLARASLLVPCLFVACATARPVPSPPPTPSDAGSLPTTPAPARKGVVVPSDMGLGAGPAGPTTNGGTNSGPAAPGSSQTGGN